MKKAALFPVILAFTVLFSCKKEIKTEAPVKTYPNLAKAEWFIGEWGNKSPEGELTERWKKENDSVYLGESYFVVGEEKDTVFGEHVRLEETNGKLSYIVTVPGQNQELPVSFEMTSATDNQIVFENPKHDYPNKIIYNLVAKDSLIAEISGLKKGKPNTERFVMKKR
ncbi:hypothetical protein HYN56_12570 [Flavobacterium crocinum]|uniref:DUF6265 domain-containing protein n=1 Tax=Flavobacterium crocinum TaxID=2183896 RepID=A0A2S1YLX8_9FLAO|nr:DUF6265 family protein [Flavobacterium crocinum]AWK05016.1 hypothetical protein HYN56_12570 [Flavobacterium crocinum]